MFSLPISTNNLLIWNLFCWYRFVDLNGLRLRERGVVSGVLYWMRNKLYESKSVFNFKYTIIWYVMPWFKVSNSITVYFFKAFPTNFPFSFFFCFSRSCLLLLFERIRIKKIRKRYCDIIILLPNEWIHYQKLCNKNQ